MSGSPLYRLVLTLALCLSLVLPAMALASTDSDKVQKPAILLAAFGTPELSALSAISNVKKRVQAAFPDYDVYMAFTSNRLCDIWHKRANDKAYRAQHPNIPEEFYTIANPLAVLGMIQARGPRRVLVQSLHVVAGGAYHNLKSIVDQLEGIKTTRRHLHPFPWIGIGAPALGMGGAPGQGTAQNIEQAVQALAPLAAEAKKNNQALVFMGHGNVHMLQPVYADLEKALRKKYGANVYVGLAEGQPGGVEDILKAVQKGKKLAGGVLLAPLLVVAGKHALNYLASDDPDSWASIFKRAGFKVTTHVKGLGSNNAWADIYVNNLKTLQSVVMKKKATEDAKPLNDGCGLNP